MKAKHTKGNWRIQEQFKEPIFVTDELGREWYALDCYIFGDNRIIGTVGYQTSIENGGWPKVEVLSEMRANAKLIASAPELLECCIKAKIHLETLDIEKGLQEDLRLAIKKATE